MNGGKRVVHFDRSILRMGGCLYAAIVAFVILGILIGAGILLGYALFGFPVKPT